MAVPGRCALLHGLTLCSGEPHPGRSLRGAVVQAVRTRAGVPQGTTPRWPLLTPALPSGPSGAGPTPSLYPPRTPQHTHHPEPSHILFTHTVSPPSEHSPHFTSARPSADTLDSVLALFCSGSLGQWRPPEWLRGGGGVSDLGNGPTEGAAGMPSWTMAQGPRWSW